MAAHISVLPLEVLNALTLQLDAEASSGLSFLRLPHPRTNISSLFLATNTTSDKSFRILEVQGICPDASRSWFNEGEVISDGKLLIMTPIDPVLLLLPILRASFSQDGTLGNFRTLDDLLEDASAKLLKASACQTSRTDASADVYTNDIMELGKLSCIQDAMKRVCESKEVASDFVVYRFSQSRFLEYLEKKAKRLSQNGIIDRSRTLVRELAKDGLMDDGKEELLEAGRLRLACDMAAQYVPPDIYEELLGKFDFVALSSHVEDLKNVSMPAAAQGTTEANDKKSQGQDGKKRKAVSQASKGVEKLKKVNVKGMAKLSSFFQKSSAKS